MQFSIGTMILYGSLTRCKYISNFESFGQMIKSYTIKTYRSIVNAIIVRIEIYVTSSEITIAKSQPEAPNGIG